MRTLILLSVLLIGFTACKKDESDPDDSTAIDLDSYHIAFKLDGVDKSLVPGATAGDFTWTSGTPDEFDPPSESTDGSYAGGFESATEYMDIENNFAYVNGDYVADRQGTMEANFATGTYVYESSTSASGIEITYVGPDGSYTTKDGSQSGSSFTISELISVDTGALAELIAKGTFSCKFYDTSGSSYDVTEGTFYVRFEM